LDYSKKTKEELIKEIELLKLKEQNVELILNDINEMFYKISFDKNNKRTIEYLSPKIEKVFGLTNKQYVENQDKLFEYFHPSELENLKKEIAKQKKSKKPVTITYRFYNKQQKKYVWLEETLVNIYAETGERTGLFGSVKDVSEKKEAENQLSFILENISECIYNVKFTEKEKILTYISPQIEQLLGLTIEEFEHEGKSGKLYKRIHPDDIGRVDENIDKELYKNKTKRINSSFRFKPKGAKEYIWIDETVHAKHDENGALTETTTVIRDITQEKIIEKHLKQNEERYRQLFTKNMAGVFITENGVIVECNNAFAKIYGYKTRMDLMGKKAQELYFIEADREKYIADLTKKGFLSNYRLKHKDKDGNEKWILTNVTLNETKEKNKQSYRRIEGTLIDITEQVNNEKRLIESEEKYKNLIENSPYGVIIHADGKILFSNSKASQIIGVKDINKHKIKNDLEDYLLPEYKKLALSRREKIQQGEELPFVDVKIKSPINNKIIDLQTKSSAIFYQNKNAIQVVFQDISAQKELAKERLKNQIAEESNKLLQREIQERIKIEQELLNNQNYTNNIISSSLDVICSSDENEKIIEFNKAAENTFGYTKKEMESVDIALLYADEESLNRVKNGLQKTGFFTGEVLNKRKNGEVFTSFLSASVLYNKDGKMIGTMGVSRDITSFKLAEQELIESEERYRDLFENASDLIQSVALDGSISYVNNAWKNTLGYTDKDIEGKSIFDFLHPDGKQHCLAFFNDIVKNNSNKTHQLSIDLLHKNRSKITVEGSVGGKHDADGKITSTRGIFRNITEEKWIKTRQEVYNNISKIISEKTQAEEIYEAIRGELGKVMNTEIFAISYAINSHTIAFPYYYDVERGGKLTTTPRAYRKGINEYFLKQKKGRILKRKELNKLINEGKYELIGPPCQIFVGVPLKIKNNVVGVLSVQSYHNENEYDEKSLEILEFVSGAIGLTVQKKYDEQLLFEQTSKLTSIIENSSHLFWTFDKNLGLTSFNQNYSDAVFDLYGFRPKIEPNTMSRVEKKELQPFWNQKYDEAFSGKKVEFITERINTKGNRVIREVYLNPIFNENNDVVLVSGIAHDITDKQIAEENLRDSLKEKEVLLKEVHHRVKNNLQVISSILNLQSSYLEDEKIINILRESQDRIKTMSIIHESLYQANDFSQINFSQYVVSLSKNLVHSYGNFDSFVETTYKIDDVHLSLDLSIPCGLIINELISNALKYAFKGREKGKLNISLQLKNGIVTIIVADNGVGIPENINIRETNSLGLQLVTSLVEQIDGELNMDNKKGTTFTITFKQIQ
jgi:PAS domain S-box-containing protein